MDEVFRGRAVTGEGVREPGETKPCVAHEVFKGFHGFSSLVDTDWSPEPEVVPVVVEVEVAVPRSRPAGW